MGTKIGIDANILICMLSNDRQITDKVLHILQGVPVTAELYISHIVLAEFYCHNTPEEYQRIQSFLKKFNINVVDFNHKSALENGNLYVLLSQNGISNTQKLKTDTLIIANYVAYNCDIIITCDTDMIDAFRDKLDTKFINPDVRNVTVKEKALPEWLYR